MNDEGNMTKGLPFPGMGGNMKDDDCLSLPTEGHYLSADQCDKIEVLHFKPPLRTDFHTYFLDIAERCAKQSTCLRRGYGAVIVDGYRTIIATGYNGAPSGTKDCLEIGKCWRQEHKIKSGSNYEKCRSVHAEMNAVIQAGKAARGCSIYIVGVDKTGNRIQAMPCALCSRIMVNAGIHSVVTEMKCSDGETTMLFYPPQYYNETNNLRIFGETNNDR